MEQIPESEVTTSLIEAAKVGDESGYIRARKEAEGILRGLISMWDDRPVATAALRSALDQIRVMKP